MTDKKISELTSITGADVSDANDVLPIVDTNVATTKKITRAELFKSVSSVDINGGTIDGVTIGGASAGAGTFSSLVATTADINGGTIDGTVIGGSTPAAISGTTGTFSSNLTVDTNTLFVYAATNEVGIRTTAPDGPLTVKLADPAETSWSMAVEGFNTAQLSHTVTDSTSVRRKLSAIEGFVGSTDISNFQGGLIFKTTPAAGTPQERLRITAAGNVTIIGSLSKGSGSFKIDHPIKSETHDLVHSFIEGPQADNIYRGKVALADGKATVNLDEAGRMTEGTFVALNGNVQCFTTNEDGWTSVRGKVEGNILTIEAQDAACADTVSWLVIGERHDPHMIDANWTDEHGRVITEPEKEIA